LDPTWRVPPPPRLRGCGGGDRRRWRGVLQHGAARTPACSDLDGGCERQAAGRERRGPEDGRRSRAPQGARREGGPKHGGPGGALPGDVPQAGRARGACGAAGVDQQGAGAVHPGPGQAVGGAGVVAAGRGGASRGGAAAAQGFERGAGSGTPPWPAPRAGCAPAGQSGGRKEGHSALAFLRAPQMGGVNGRPRHDNELRALPLHLGLRPRVLRVGRNGAL